MEEENSKNNASDPMSSSHAAEEQEDENPVVMTEGGKESLGKEGHNETREASAETDFDTEVDYRSSPSVTLSIFIFWILPVLFLAIYSRVLVDTETPPKPVLSKDLQRPLSVNIKPSAAGAGSSAAGGETSPTRTSRSSSSSTGTKKKKKGKERKPSGGGSSSRTSPTISKSSNSRRPSPAPVLNSGAYSGFPTRYQKTVNTIAQRRRKIYQTLESSQTTSKVAAPSALPSKPSSSTSSEPTKRQETRASPNAKKQQGYGASSDPLRIRMNRKISELREEYQADPDDVFKIINLADMLRRYDMSYHDGGTKQPEALEMYELAIQMTLEKKEKLLLDGEPTDETPASRRGEIAKDIPMEVALDYKQKSVDGTLCALYSSRGKVFFMANMFEKAVEQYSKCLEISPLYLDALSSRGSSQIITGRYKEAAMDFMATIEHDTQHMFTDAFTGLARLLSSNENVIPEGWGPAIDKLGEIIPTYEGMMSSVSSSDGKAMLSNTLNRLHHVMFTYHDSKTKDRDEAWYHLQLAYKHKMSALPPWKSGYESTKIKQTKQIFRRGFWPVDVGSQSKVPVFIVGFVRSGSTLLERVLDSHPQIVGTGEDSVFNGRLDDIRNKIVETSMTMDQDLLGEVVEDLAEGVVDEMRDRWKVIDSNTEKDENETDTKIKNPKRFVDKMLNNYYNIGFIHMLFPNALILHVVREPMDTCFSAYKHEFPPGTLDYTSEFKSLAELYHGYRDLMDHWDKELPGRVTHVRYDDMVHDMPGVAKAVIKAAGLPWNDDVLNFHRKKHAVNTLSTTQVRKGVYKDSLQAWRKYETELQPLVKLLGDRVNAPYKTSLAGYKPPSTSEAGEEGKASNTKSI